jgi:hypothetical protein
VSPAAVPGQGRHRTARALALVVHAEHGSVVASTAKPSPLTRPAFMHALTTASNACRNRSLSRKRPWRLTRTSNDAEPCRRERVGKTSKRPSAVRPPRIACVRRGCHSCGNDQHTDHELRVDRRATDVAVEGLKLLAHAGEHAGDGRVDAA